MESKHIFAIKKKPVSSGWGKDQNTNVNCRNREVKTQKLAFPCRWGCAQLSGRHLLAGTRPWFHLQHWRQKQRTGSRQLSNRGRPAEAALLSVETGDPASICEAPGACDVPRLSTTGTEHSSD